MPVAQLDRVSDSDSEGRRFESCRAYHTATAQVSRGGYLYISSALCIVSTYCVEKLEKLSPDAVDTVLNSGYDLVLYTCTKGGRTRVIVFCDRAAETASSSAPRQTEK